jgi:hypothetical protein
MLARFSLLRTERARLAGFVTLVGLMSNACLDSPPTYSSPGQVPPFIIEEGTRPRSDQFIRVDPGDELDLFVQFISVDVGEQVLGVIYLDFESDTDLYPSRRATLTLAPSPLGLEETRDANFAVRVPGSFQAGCHTLTLLLAHQSAWNISGGRPSDPERAARVIWWLDVPGDGPLRPCPTEGEGAP